MSILGWLLKPHANKTPKQEVEETPVAQEARRQIARAQVLIEIDEVEAVVRGSKRGAKRVH